MLRECISLSMPKETALFRAPWTLDDGEKSSNSADKRFKTPYLDLWEWLQEDDEKVEKHPLTAARKRFFAQDDGYETPPTHAQNDDDRRPSNHF